MPILRRAISSSPPRPWLFGAFAVAAGVATVPIPRTSSAVPDARARDDGGMKIVSLLPSATEIVFALGVDDELAGVSFECDYPPAARAVPVVSGTALPTDGSLTAKQIDDEVSARVAAGESIYTLDAARIRTIDPDLILAQDLCQVCAVPSGVVEDALAVIGCQRRGLPRPRKPRGGHRLHRLVGRGDGDRSGGRSPHGRSSPPGGRRSHRGSEGRRRPRVLGTWSGPSPPSTPVTGCPT